MMTDRPVYAQVRDEYEEMYPSSIPRMEAVISEYPDWLPPTVGAMFATASVLSGIHTTATIRELMPKTNIVNFLSVEVANTVKDIVSIGSFVTFELALFITAYAMLKGSQWLTWLAATVAFLVAAVANVANVQQQTGLQDLSDLVLTVTVGIGSPLIALLAGKMFVSMYESNRKAILVAKARYKQAEKEHDDRIAQVFEDKIKAWEAAEALRLEAERKERARAEAAERRLERRTESTTGTEQGGQGRTRYVPSTVPGTVPKAVRDLADILKQNRGDLRLGAAAIRAKYKCGQETANKAKQVALAEMAQEEANGVVGHQE